MRISKALITAAGQSQRQLPLQTFVDREGRPQTVLAQLVAEALSAGIESIGIVVCPGDGELYAQAAGEHAEKIHFIEQAEPRGYGDAVHQGRSFIGSDPFLLMVSDHLYLSRHPGKSCARQLIDMAESERCAVSAVQATHESLLSAFGAIGGRLFDIRPGLYEVQRVMEKPTPTQAEQHLLTPGLRMGHYLCFFGLHVVTPSIFPALEKGAGLSAALDSLVGKERLLAFEVQGRRYDLEERYGFLAAQLAMALDGSHRAEILARMVELLAEQ